MKKPALLKITNLLIALAFAILAVSSGTAKFVPDLAMPAFKIHEYTGYLFFVLAVIHIYLNWTWIRSTFFKKTAQPK
jgi:cytochrome b561